MFSLNQDLHAVRTCGRFLFHHFHQPVQVEGKSGRGDIITPHERNKRVIPSAAAYMLTTSHELINNAGVILEAPPGRDIYTVIDVHFFKHLNDTHKIIQ